MNPKEEIITKLDEMSGKDKGYKYAQRYLSDYGIGGYDKIKFRTVETLYTQYTAFELKEPYALAEQTARLFIEYFYDTTDVENKDEVTDRLLACYVEATGDKYAVYRNEEQHEIYDTDMSGSFVGIGVQVQYDAENNTLLVVSVNKGSTAEEAGILPGDYIYAVDGETLDDIGYESMVSKIRGEIGTKVTVTVKRAGELIDLVATRIQIIEYTVVYEINDDGIGYVQLTGFKDNTAEQFRKAIDFLEKNSCVGIIFDLRNNPGGYLNSVIEVIDYLVPDETRIVSYKYAAYPEQVYYADDGHEIDVPITVICNGYTASAGELFTAAIRDYSDMGLLDATIVGETTYAKGVMQNTFALTDKSTLTLTVAFYNPPSNVNYDGIGVIPDVEIANGESSADAQLACAYSELKKLIDTK